ncbi:Putative berberine/berberine, FAD-binding domain, PCMH-type, FAD-binding, type PCMH, subdomain 2 [Colletotrichum destructivum]|uniref:Berberine/berberine, FAD-binding domain, PCMH-type, FAD-binding, type PCMH, subdomain 2 n=1 Tax=Colletotrichum destructivum TaxID=34406 RepID=A0AAX4J3N6_9PEZI|nr:Putative berberine/berberine, FAD-binding domain, PCMH-type, FAD-binding, type PCMH, subdomain 2 [Colletotrichum destructivum]
MRAAVLYCCSGFIWTLSAGASIPRYFEEQPNTRRSLTSTQVQQELGGWVSNTTSIFGPDDGRFDDVTSRWTDFSKPNVQVVIEPGTESDVQAIVEYCNANSINFLAINGGHGLSATLSTFNGIQINMRQLDNIDIQPSHKSAWFGGGTIVGQVIQTLWDKGFVTTTGGCECVGMLGAGLGGGHGRYEGLYGMISDNMLQLNVVLANGSAIRVNTTSHSDLFWAMRGAGHNFGIVTSYEMNIWPSGPKTWHFHNYVWRGEHLELVFDALNKFHNNGSTPVNMAFNAGSFVMNTTITNEEPIIMWSFAYRGPAEEAERHLAPFNAIESVFEVSGDVPYSKIPSVQGTGYSDPICQHGSVHSTSTAGLQVYNLTAERLIYNGFKRRIAQDSDLAAGTVIIHEGYSTEGVDAVDPDSSAYPFRADHHLMLFDAAVPHGQTARLEAAWAWAAEVRDQWNEGQPDRAVHAYVNYATGMETLEERYGHDGWRLERLRDLKVRYDPNNRFRYYNPIIVG